LTVAKDIVPDINSEFVGSDNNADDDMEPLMELPSQIANITGVINQEEIGRLRKIIFRVTKGKSLIYVKEFINNEGGDDDYYKNKSVFIISFKDGEYIKEKIIKIVDSFEGLRFELPELQQIPETIIQKQKDLEESRDVFNASKA